MRKIAFILAALICTGCGKNTGNAGNGAFGLTIYQDGETGCEYVANGIQGGLVARIGPNGHTHLGCKNGDQK